MSEQKQYPEWQAQIREAQAVKRTEWQRSMDARDEERRQKEADEQADLGQMLLKVLALLGVEIETPTTNSAVLGGGYVVSLGGKLRENINLFRGDSQTYTTFTLHMKRLACPPLKDNYRNWDAAYGQAHSEFQLKDGRATVSHFAQLADLLDEVDRKVEGCLDNHFYALKEREYEEQREAARLARVGEYDKSVPEQPHKSDGEKLEDLIRRIAREELEAKLGW